LAKRSRVVSHLKRFARPLVGAKQKDVVKPTSTDPRPVTAEVAETNRIADAALEDFCDTLNIDGKKRILLASHLFWNAKNGDAWHVLQRVPIYEEKYGCKLVILVRPETRKFVEERAALLEYDGYRFEFAELPKNFPITDSSPDDGGPIRHHSRLSGYLVTRPPTDRVRSIYPMYREPNGNTELSRFFRTTKGSFTELGVRKPRVTPIDTKHYIEKYGIVPSKTFIIVPESVSVPTYPPAYWNMVASVLRNAGFAVIFNSNDKRYDGPLVLAPWKDVLGLVELCGHVYGVRSGFFDFAIDADAEFTIIGPNYHREHLDIAHYGSPQPNIHWVDYGPYLDRDALPELAAAHELSVHFVDWVFELSAKLDDLVVFIVSKDTHCSTKKSTANHKLKIMNQLGLQYDFTESPKSSYLAVIDGGQVVTEKFDKSAEVIFEYQFGPDEKHHAKLNSFGHNVPYGHDIYSRIWIDGTNLSMNKRGLNFVIWDKKKDQFVDSVSFDTAQTTAISDHDQKPGRLWRR
jgi:hypothetical protein